MVRPKTIEWYFQQGLPWVGRWEMPLIRRQDVDLDDLALVRFSDCVRDESRDLGATVHFFIDDARFDEVWADPEGHIAELAQYRQVMSPDFSLYLDMPVPLQFVNTLRSRWCGAYWQSQGLTVIPTINWSDGRSYDFCFEGVEPGSVVAVATVGSRDVKPWYMRSFKELCRAIKPEAVICYGEPFPEMSDHTEVIEVPYARDRRVSKRSSGVGGGR